MIYSIENDSNNYPKLNENEISDEHVYKTPYTFGVNETMYVSSRIYPQYNCELVKPISIEEVYSEILFKEKNKSFEIFT
ncbi:hypothetical protein BpHYR1_044816 [Brachionus plicatilis]|uniref:Uncharacterized protein n=1 Tax=Brachionus plicatilis TaxID=10195 RepID=A0A3M7QH83_BRAPC|nr:hypothetical protein BpHYR1_044816 [Brachionus plicatilis]